jgi:hypothetical protein
MNDEPIPENFGALPPIPYGWSVRLTEHGGGHFIVCDPEGEERSDIHWNRYVVRKWAIRRANEAHSTQEQIDVSRSVRNSARAAIGKGE